jgi:hypothetical protein
VYAWLIGAAAGRKRLHRVAAAYCEQVLDDPLEAAWHYARAGLLAEAAGLLAAGAAGLAARGQPERAADLAAELLGQGRASGDTARQLLTARGDLLLHTQRAAEAEDAYRKALACPASPAVRARVAWRLGQCLLQRGNVDEALALCCGAAAGLDGDETVLRAHLMAVQSQAHLMLSEFGAAASAASGQALAGRRRSGRPRDRRRRWRGRPGRRRAAASGLPAQPVSAMQAVRARPDGTNPARVIVCLRICAPIVVARPGGEALLPPGNRSADARM